MKYKCLSIAGFDGSGGAGIQADLKTFSALGCYGMTVLTAIAAQNTRGVKSCYDIPLQCIQDQLETIFDDIRPDAIKIGMLYSAPIITLIADFLTQHAKNIPVVLDPVMLAKSGDALLKPDAIDALKTKLMPLCTLITPNLPEAETLVGKHENAQALAQALLSLKSNAVLLKGGHAEGNTADDFLFMQTGETHTLSATRIQSKNTHGTGCTLSAAICSELAKGKSLLTACEQAKTYLHGAMLASVEHSVGQGHGPVHHFYQWWPATE
jgi:hydroxymethylpyrimidine/phosphomethylpyrimidine kinase